MNSVNPGLVRTPMLDLYGLPQEKVDEIVANSETFYPVGRKYQNPFLNSTNFTTTDILQVVGKWLILRRQSPTWPATQLHSLQVNFSYILF